jgi:hypothetical protein
MDADTEKLIRYLMSHLECVTCQHRYSIEDFEVLEKGAKMVILLMTCRNCLTQSLLMAFLQEQGAEEIDPSSMTPAEGEDEPRPITADDVMDVHRFLASFDGDCIALVRG